MYENSINSPGRQGWLGRSLILSVIWMDFREGSCPLWNLKISSGNQVSREGQVINKIQQASSCTFYDSIRNAKLSLSLSDPILKLQTGSQSGGHCFYLVAVFFCEIQMIQRKIAHRLDVGVGLSTVLFLSLQCQPGKNFSNHHAALLWGKRSMLIGAQLKVKGFCLP